MNEIEAHIEVLCNKNVWAMLKGKLYRVMVELKLLYGAEWWPMKNVQIYKIKVADENAQMLNVLAY